MVFNINLFYLLCVVIILAWLVVLTINLKRSINHYNKLSQGITKISLTDVLNRLFQEQILARRQIESLSQATKDLQIQGKQHIQKIGVVRFNPFSDTGGSQSFTLALLDGNQNGIILTSLYGRSGGRWYIKLVKNGRGQNIDLAREEEAAIKNALPLVDIHFS